MTWAFFFRVPVPVPEMVGPAATWADATSTRDVHSTITSSNTRATDLLIRTSFAESIYRLTEPLRAHLAADLLSQFQGFRPLHDTDGPVELAHAVVFLVNPAVNLLEQRHLGVIPKGGDG